MTMGRFLRVAALPLALAACNVTQADPAADAAPARVEQQFPPSPATIAMRWHLLDPEVNSFTFRETKDVFAFRPVPAPQTAWSLETGPALAMPAATVDGKVADYAGWADGTFTNAFLVLRDGKIVFEDYRNRMAPATRHIAFSMSKTITALLLGQAVEKGEIASIDDPVSKYVPELATSAYGKASLRNVMEMRSGADIDERYDFGENPSLAAKIHETAIIRNEARFADFAVDLPSRDEPGKVFNYATLNTAVLGWVLENATGQKIEDLTRERLWQPLGAQYDAFWLADGAPGVGRALNGMGFNATLRDFGRLGLLLLNKGQANGQQIVPESWVAAMTTMKPTGQPLPGYGFQTWQVDNEPGAFAAVGLAGQFIYVHPSTDTVIVKLSYNPPVEPEWLTPDVLAYFAKVANLP